MRRVVCVLSVFALVILVGCKKEEPQQTTPPPTTDQLGTGQQFGYPSQSGGSK